MSKTVKILLGALAGIVLVLAIVVIAGFVSGERDDSWSRVKSAGKIVIGTSADYPPFEYYNQAAELDGFDIALMNEIGRRLGVQVDYRDYAFDGLGAAMQVGEIDAALAAISISPEREAVVDFSNVYYVGQEGVLARADREIYVPSPESLAGYRVGVQTGTIYDDWLQRELVATGRMPVDSVFVYAEAEHAVRGLREDRIDLVVMDLQPAEAFVAEGDVKLVAQGLSQQRYALALPKGAASLKAEIDQAINALYNEGVVARLADEYLGVSEIAPTPLPEPTSTPAPPPSCVDDLLLVEHLTPEGQTTPEKQPGEQFVKRWRVRNTGTCTWDSSYRIIFTAGNDPAAGMGGKPTRIQGQVAPGATYDLEISLVAPADPGTYRAYWQMYNGSGQAFGERLRVSIAVPAVPTATPIPTQTPVPGITFSVDRIEIKAGECVNFYWKVSNVKAVYFYRDGQKWEDHGVPGEGSRVECPPVTTSYYLRVLHRDDSVETRQIRIYVEPAADAPAIVRFTVDPPGQVVLGECVTLRWEIVNPVNNVRLTANGGTLWDAAPVKGTYQHCPAETGTVGYGIEATGPGGTARGQQSINVVAGAPDDPLAQTRWQVTTLYDPELGSPSVPLPSTALTVFFGTGGNLNGSSGCNTYSASYVVDGALLSITPPLGTGIACTEPDGIMEQEDLFLTALTEVGSFRLTGMQLTLLNASGQSSMELISLSR